VCYHLKTYPPGVSPPSQSDTVPQVLVEFDANCTTHLIVSSWDHYVVIHRPSAALFHVSRLIVRDLAAHRSSNGTLFASVTPDWTPLKLVYTLLLADGELEGFRRESALNLAHVQSSSRKGTKKRLLEEGGVAPGGSERSYQEEGLAEGDGLLDCGGVSVGAGEVDGSFQLSGETSNDISNDASTSINTSYESEPSSTDLSGPKGTVSLCILRFASYLLQPLPLRYTSTSASPLRFARSRTTSRNSRR